MDHSPRKPAAVISTDELRLDQAWSDLDLDAACAAVRRGDLAGGMVLLKKTPASLDVRSIRVFGLGQAAIGRSELLEMRLTARPRDPDLLLWLGQTLVAEAWEVRRSAAAEHVSGQRAATFQQILKRASVALRAAIDAAPDDAVPWEVLQWAALGMQKESLEKEFIFDSAVERNPDSFAAHVGRVQVLAPKWSVLELGELVGFGELVAGKAKPGSVLGAVLAYVIAEVYLDVMADGSAAKVRRLTREVGNQREAVLAARDRWWVVDRVAEAPDVAAHGAMAFALKVTGASGAAMEHAALTGGRIETLPWAYTQTTSTGDPLVGFATAVANNMS
ncbi:hypothetical protein AB0P21_35675 [Kribbella sp. NPDC056861]|uniref:hypothetical protein n=1 Tax=Kribbella sp. NPDC056861 TaxID=3154857 RepID=UPI00342AB355